MDILPLLCVVLVGFSGFTDAAGLLPDAPLSAAVGKSVTFNTTLNATDTTLLVVTWSFGETQIIHWFPTTNTTDDAYRDRITLFRSTGSLELRNLAISDSGEYSVIIVDNTGSRTDRTTLIISEPISNVRAEADRTDLNETSSVRLSCSSSGSSLSFLWMNGSSEVTESERVKLTDGGSTLSITNVLRYDHHRNFSCKVSNPVSEGTSNIIRLFVNYGPENTNLTRSPSQDYYEKGSDITLTCSADSRPDAGFNWFLDGEELPDTAPELRLVKVQRSGNYSCRTFNSKTLRGESSEVSSVSVLDAFLTSTIRHPIEGNPVNLSCDAVGPNVTEREWRKDGSALSLSDNMKFYEESRVLSFQPLKRADGGEYSCNVTNPINTVEAKYTMVVNYGPENINITGVSEIRYGETFTLICSAGSEPAAKFTWTLNGKQIHTSAQYTKKASDSDRGNYTCEVQNSVTGRSLSAQHELSVTGVPSPPLWIIGVVIACLVVIAAFVVGFCCHKKKKSQPKFPSSSVGGEGQDNTAFSGSQDVNYADIKVFHNKKSGGVRLGSHAETDYAEVRGNKNAPAGSSSLPTYEDHMQRGRGPAAQPDANGTHIYAQVQKK